MLYTLKDCQAFGNFVFHHLCDLFQVITNSFGQLFWEVWNWDAFIQIKKQSSGSIPLRFARKQNTVSEPLFDKDAG